MNNYNFDKIYNKVPEDQKKRFLKFRASHPYKNLKIGHLNWKYIASGKDKDAAIVLLPGGIRTAEAWEGLITILEKEYRVIVPTYPAIKSIKEGQI